MTRPAHFSARMAVPASNPDSGFTLIEVLVATALMGVALGVLLSGLAQGHRQAFRGDTAREAAYVAETVLRDFFQDRASLSDEGEIEQAPGWRYRMELRELLLPVETAYLEESDSDAPSQTALEIPELSELVLTITPPEGAQSFVLTSIVPAEEP